MESTGKYCIPVYNVLKPTCKIVLTHPKYVKAIRGEKTEKSPQNAYTILFHITTQHQITTNYLVLIWKIDYE